MTATSTATATETATASPPTISLPTVTQTPVEPATVSLSGQYNLSMNVKSGPAGHAPFVGMPPVLLGKVELGSIMISGTAPWVRVRGPLNEDGSFRATGTEVVAGRAGIGVELDVKLTNSGLTGVYALGVQSVGGMRVTEYRESGQSAA